MSRIPADPVVWSATVVLTPLRVGLLWHSLRSGNLGVVALTLANMRLISDVAHELGLEPCFTIIGMRDSLPVAAGCDAVETFDVTFRSLVNPFGFWRCVRAQDCVIDIGAGDSFAEIYGAKRFAYLWISKVITSIAGTPYLLAPQTIGPFKSSRYKALARVALGRAVSVLARDRPSLEAARELCPLARNWLATDVAFALPYDKVDAPKGSRRAVGINVSGLLYRDAQAGRNRFGLDYDYVDLTRTLIQEMLGERGADVHLIAHVSSPGDSGDDDSSVCDELHCDFPQAVRVPDFAGPCEAKSYMSGLDFMVGARMHACIGAFSAGVPVIPIAYSRKFDGLFGTLGYRHLVPAQGMDTKDALGFILRAFDARDTVKEELADATQRVSSFLSVYRAELRGLFRMVAG
jgi:colanic acid/amylovoran biosynthesis protein